MVVTNNLDFGSVARITNLPDAASNQEPATLAQLNAAIEGLNWKDDIVVMASSNVNLASPGATVDGVALSNGQRFGVRGQTTASQNGLYIYNGSAVAATRSPDMNVSAEFNQAVVAVQQGTDAGTQWRQTAVNPTVGTTPIAFVAFGTSAPGASETTAGIAEIATQAETDAGTDDLRFVTPLKLATYSGRLRRVTATIGDNSATQFDVTHNLNNYDVVVQVYEFAGNRANIIVDIRRTDVNTVRLNFVSAPTTNQYRVVVIG